MLSALTISPFIFFAKDIANLDFPEDVGPAIKIIFLDKNKSNIFNLGSGKCYSVLDVIRNCEKIIKKNANILSKNLRKHDAAILMCDISKSDKILKWKPIKSNLKKIIQDEIWWFKYLKKKKIIRKYIY